MKFGLSGCNTGPFAGRELALTLGRLADQNGIESLWTYEHVVVPEGYESRYPYSPTGRMPGDGSGPITDPLTWSAVVAGATEKVKLGTGILILPEHNPVILAKTCATLDQLSQGRLLLGIGVGWLREEFEALGVPWEARGARTDEYVHAMRALWTQDKATYKGKFVHFENAKMNPKPYRPEGVPIIVGGHTEAAARRAGRLGDGFYPAAAPQVVAGLLEVMRTAAKKAGRNPDEIEVTSGLGRNWDDVKRYEDAGVSRLILRVPGYDLQALDRRMKDIGEKLVARYS